MNKNSLIIFSIAFGSVIGYFIGLASKCPLSIVILVTLNGAFFGHFLGMTLFWKRYSALTWGVVTTLIAIIVDWIAGSSKISLLDKLAFATAGLFIGFDFWSFWKQTLMMGCIVGIIGFIWGMFDDLWFGYAHLQPSLLNAIFSSIKGFIFGMVIGNMYMQVWGSRQVIQKSESKG